MTKEEIKQLFAQTASGNEVDGGALIKILEQVVNSSIAIEVNDIEDLTDEQLNSLNCGDKVVKVTGKQKHTYIVSYKGEGIGEGLTLTYTDASVVETVSYDFTADGWQYNSTDKTNIAS